MNSTERWLLSLPVTIIAGVLALGACMRDGTAAEGEQVAIPAVIGVRAAEAKQTLEGVGLTPRFRLGQSPLGADDALRVYAVNPASGTLVAPGSVVEVTIYAAAETAGTMPAASSSAVGELTGVSATQWNEPDGEAIDPRSGRLLLETTDLIVPAGAIQLELSRSLQLEAGEPGLLGGPWRLNWEKRAQRNQETAVIEEGAGQTVFAWDAVRRHYRSVQGDVLMFDGVGATRVTPDGNRETYDGQGRFVARDERNGNRIGLRYDAQGRLARVEGPFGAFFELSVDGDGRLTSVGASTGAAVRYIYGNAPFSPDQAALTLRYAYDAARRLIYLDHPTTGAVRLTRDDQGRVTGRAWDDGSEESYEYDAQSRLRRYINGAGEATSITTSPDGKRVEVVDPLGQKTVLEFDAAGRALAVTGPAGRSVRFTYDELGRRVRDDDSAAGPTAYEYLADSGLLSAEADPDGRRTSFEHDGELNVVGRSVEPPLRKEATFAYSPAGLLGASWSPQSGKSALSYDAQGRLTGIEDAAGYRSQFEFDPSGNLLRYVDQAGGVTALKYDAGGRLQSITDPVGGTTRYTYGPAGLPQIETGPTGGATRYAYDRRGRLINETDPLGRTTSYAYRPGGLLKSIVNPAGHGTSFEYDVLGNRIGEINPLGGLTLRTYDAVGQMTSEIDPTGSTTRYEYSPRGDLMREIDAAGADYQYLWDARGRMIRRIAPSGRITNYEYAAGDDPVKIVPPSGPAVTFDYDAAGNLRAVREGPTLVAEFEYDALNRAVKERYGAGLTLSNRYDAAGNLVGVSDGLGGSLRGEYDAAGRPTAVTDGGGSVTRYQYDADGNVTGRTDPLGQVQRRTYDLAGQLIEVAEPNGDRARYEYDLAGNVKRVRHPGGGQTRYVYDGLGNATEITDPLDNVSRYTYDPAGRLLGATDQEGRSTRLVYDIAGRVTERQLPDGKTVRYEYDKFGNLTEADDGAFPIRRRYDLDGNLTQIEYPAIRRTLRYEYDDRGRRVKFTDGEGRTTDYVYDDFDRLLEVRSGDAGAISFTYDAKNRPLTTTYPNGVRGTWEYDAADRTVRLHYTAADGKPLAGWAYAYDAAGNCIEATDAQGDTTRYRYDPSGQLVEEEAAGKKTRYDYLPGGNRGRKQRGAEAVEYRYNQADQLLSAGQETYQYDVGGNLVERRGPQGVTHYTYDAENQLVKVDLPGGDVVSYGYAPTGERIWREDSKGRTWFVTDGTNLIGELDANLTPKSSYLHCTGIDTPFFVVRGGQSYFLHGDRVGSVRVATNRNGAVVEASDFDAFGNRTAEPTAVGGSPFTFGAREFDTATGLYYYRARYYEPSSGRFISRDPSPPRAAMVRSWNSYLYADNSPLGFVDPTGTVSEELLNSMNPPEAVQFLENRFQRLEYELDQVLRGHVPTFTAGGVTYEDFTKTPSNLIKELEGLRRQALQRGRMLKNWNRLGQTQSWPRLPAGVAPSTPIGHYTGPEFRNAVLEAGRNGGTIVPIGGQLHGTTLAPGSGARFPGGIGTPRVTRDQVSFFAPAEDWVKAGNRVEFAPHPLRGAPPGSHLVIKPPPGSKALRIPTSIKGGGPFLSRFKSVLRLGGSTVKRFIPLLPLLLALPTYAQAAPEDRPHVVATAVGGSLPGWLGIPGEFIAGWLVPPKSKPGAKKPSEGASPSEQKPSETPEATPSSTTSPGNKPFTDEIPGGFKPGGRPPEQTPGGQTPGGQPGGQTPGGQTPATPTQPAAPAEQPFDWEEYYRRVRQAEQKIAQARTLRGQVDGARNVLAKDQQDAQQKLKDAQDGLKTLATADPDLDELRKAAADLRGLLDKAGKGGDDLDSAERWRKAAEKAQKNAEQICDWAGRARPRTDLFAPKPPPGDTQEWKDKADDLIDRTAQSIDDAEQADKQAAGPQQPGEPVSNDKLQAAIGRVESAISKLEPQVAALDALGKSLEGSQGVLKDAFNRRGQINQQLAQLQGLSVGTAVNGLLAPYDDARTNNLRGEGARADADARALADEVRKAGGSNLDAALQEISAAKQAIDGFVNAAKSEIESARQLVARAKEALKKPQDQKPDQTKEENKKKAVAALAQARACAGQIPAGPQANPSAATPGNQELQGGVGAPPKYMEAGGGALGNLEPKAPQALKTLEHPVPTLVLVRVPDVVGQSAADAMAQLAHVTLHGTFQLGQPAPSSVEAMRVYQQSPSAGAVVNVGSSVSLTIYDQHKPAARPQPTPSASPTATPRATPRPTPTASRPPVPTSTPPAPQQPPKQNPCFYWNGILLCPPPGASPALPPGAVPAGAPRAP